MEEDEKGENWAYLDLQQEILVMGSFFGTKKDLQRGISTFCHKKFPASAKIRSCALAREEFQKRAREIMQLMMLWLIIAFSTWIYRRIGRSRAACFWGKDTRCHCNNSLLDGNGYVKRVFAQPQSLILLKSQDFSFSWSNLNSPELRDAVVVRPNLGILDRSAWFSPKSTETRSEHLLQGVCSVWTSYYTEINREFQPNRIEFDNYVLEEILFCFSRIVLNYNKSLVNHDQHVDLKEKGVSLVS